MFGRLSGRPYYRCYAKSGSRLAHQSAASKVTDFRLILVTTAAFGAAAIANSNYSIASSTVCDSNRAKGADVVMLGPTAEPSTGILFPRLCNGMTFVGCGVRVKWRVVKVYAVGTYVDPTAFRMTENDNDQAVSKALLDPVNPRTIRVVMNRAVSMDKYVAAIVEALKPRMNGQDLEKLEEFKKLNPPGDLAEGSVMEMTIRGDTLLYRNNAGTVGAIRSMVFTRAMCDVYYGDNAVSPAHKDDVIKGILNL